MKVIAILKDGTTRTVEIPERSFSHATPTQAIEYAKGVLPKSDREQVKSWEVEEDFL